ncbi:outer membrane lipid asymmetry maintenance protein MlaD [Acetobacteraceae bacterium ESL0709]|nr:outer membrane lipid asymmetry maintenance protein MlaD [Acetobacteraceae bacterium ESL0697]MDF7677187.1 outer membrane lipid asymmetry maintenance protein MlaD [Acetobacteraceae bacterium ESL0709]
MDGEVADKDFLKQQVRQTHLELITGLVVVVALGGLLLFAILGRHQAGNEGYALRASFAHIDGLSVGSDVRLAGVTVGHVVKTVVDPKNFQANVTFSISPSVQLPADSGAIITSDSLLGGKYIALTPGGDEKMLSPGAVIQQTQGAISLEQLLSKFIFSVTDSLQQKNKHQEAASPENNLP